MTWKRTLLLFSAFVVLLSAATWFVLRKTGVAKAFVQRMLAERIAPPFALDGADLDLGRGTLALRDLAIAHPLDQSRPLLRARDVLVSVNTNPLGEVGRVDKIVLSGVRVDDLQVSGPHALRLDDIFKTGRSGDQADGSPVYPAVIVEDASIGVRFADDGLPMRFEDVDLELLPLAASNTEMVLRGSMTTPLGTRVQVSGEGDIGARRFRVLATTESVPLSPATVASFSPDIAAVLTNAAAEGHVAQAKLWIETDEHDGTLHGGFQVEVDRFTFRARQFPRRVEGRASVRGVLQGEGRVDLTVEAEDERGRIHLQGEVQRLLAESPVADLALHIAALRIDDEMLSALAVPPASARVVRAFAPGATGQVDADAQVRIRDGTVEVDVDAVLSGMTASFLGFAREGEPQGPTVSFPYPLHDVGGRLRVRSGIVELDDLQAADAHGGTVRLSGAIPVAAHNGRIDILGTDVRFGPDLRAALQALAPIGVHHYDDCAPEGRTELRVAVAGIGSSAPTFHIHLEPQRAALTHAVFPYRCEDVTGAIDISGDEVTFDLHGNRAGKGIAARGRFARQAAEAGDAELASEFWLRADGFALDADLQRALTALAPSTAELWPMLTPSGEAACEVTTWRPAGDPHVHYDLRLDVLEGRLRPAAFPLAIEQLQGPIFVHGDGDTARVDVHLLRGRLPQAAAERAADVLITGSALQTADDTSFDLTTVARAVQLRPELRDTLDRAGALPAAAWDALHPKGTVDVICRHQAAAKAPPTTHVRLHLDDVSLSAAWLPDTVSALTGEVVATSGRATAAELRGRLGTAALVLNSAEVWHAPDGTRMRATIGAADLPLNDDLARLLGDSPLRRAYLARRVRGRADVTALDLECAVPDAGVGKAGSFRLNASGQMTLHDCSLVMAVPIEHVDGILTVRECAVTADSGRVDGALANLSMQILSHPVHDFSAGFTADADQIVLDDLSLRLHGGRVVGDPGPPHLRYLTAGEGTLSTNLSWQGVRLSELANPGSRNPSAGVSGNLSGRLLLEALRGTRLIDMVAHGSVHVTGGRLGDVPLFRSIYAVLRRQPQFATADATFRVGDRRIAIDSLTLGSSILDVHAKGKVSMDGYVDMNIDLPDLFGDAADFLILPEILHTAVAQVLEFKLHGYLRNPEIKPLTLFQGAPARREIGPIPAPLPDVPRRRF